MWETINRLYLYLGKGNAISVFKEGQQELFQYVKEMSQLFQGVTDSTFIHRDGYEFIMMGKFLERADKTGRILDSKHYMESESAAGQDALAIAQWTALLNGCSALEAYHHVYVTDVTPENSADFLLLSRDFPRSVLYCLLRLQASVHSISNCPLNLFSNEAERLCGYLISQLSYARMEDILKRGLSDFLEEIRVTINAIAVELNKQYMLTSIVDPVEQLQSQ
jgi:uncharacterized alpha-E superfamily protein